MARSRKSSIELTAYDDLFQTDESRAEAALSKIRDIPISEIDEFPDHPFTPIQSVYAAEMTSVIKINEVESNEPTTDIDWVEIINTGTEAVDLSNWFITDNKDLERLAERRRKSYSSWS